MKRQYSHLSNVQKIKFKEVCGYEYKGDSLSGRFMTDRPYDRDWHLSPWHFSFVFKQDTGFLFCELAHRMTNNRAFGWDYEGNELNVAIIEEIYPPDYIIIKNPSFQ